MREFLNERILDAMGLRVAKRPKKVASLDLVDIIVLFTGRRLTMDLVLMTEVLHRGEHLAKSIANLCHGRFLLVKVPAINRYTKVIYVGLTGRHRHVNFLVLK